MLQTLTILDIKYLNLIRGMIDPHSHIQVELIKLLSDFGIFVIALVLLGLWIYGIYTKKINYKEIALMIFYSIAFSFVIYLILNKFLPMRSRPEDASRQIQPLIAHIPDNSLPSGHAIFSGAAILAMFLFQKRKCISIIVLIFSLLMLFSRIAAGVHFPGDIIVGLVVGFAGTTTVYYYRDSQLFKKYLLPYPIKLASYLKL